MSNVLTARFSVGPLCVDTADLIAGVPLLASLVAGILAWPELPGEMAVHFQAGNPDWFVAKPLGVSLVPAIGFATIAFVRTQIPDGLTRLLNVGFVGLTLSIGQGYVLAWNLGYELTPLVVLVPALGGGALLVLADTLWLDE